MICIKTLEKCINFTVQLFPWLSLGCNSLWTATHSTSCRFSWCWSGMILIFAICFIDLCPLQRRFVDMRCRDPGTQANKRASRNSSRNWIFYAFQNFRFLYADLMAKSSVGDIKFTFFLQCLLSLWQAISHFEIKMNNCATVGMKKKGNLIAVVNSLWDLWMWRMQLET